MTDMIRPRLALLLFALATLILTLGVAPVAAQDNSVPDRPEKPFAFRHNSSQCRPVRVCEVGHYR